MAFTFLVFGTCAIGRRGCDQPAQTTCIASTFSPPTRANSERGSSGSFAAPIFFDAYQLRNGVVRLSQDVQPRFRWTRRWAPAGVERQACHLKQQNISSRLEEQLRSSPRHVAAVHPSTSNPGRVVDGHGAIVHERSKGGRSFMSDAVPYIMP